MAAWPHQADYGEGVVLSLTDAWVRGDPLYRDPSVYPWRATPYPPLYMAVCAVLSPWLGVALAAGRLVSWLAALGVVACVALAASARAAGGGRDARMVAGLAAAAFFLCSPLTLGWSAMVRVDFLALLWETLGVVVVDAALLRCEKGKAPRWSHLALAGLLFAFAFFTKQSFILGGIAACAVMLARDRRAGAGLAAWTVCCIAGPFALGEWRTGGALFPSLFTHNVMPWSWDRAWPWLSQYARVAAIPAVIALAFGRKGGAGPVWWTYLCLSMATLLGVGRVGAYYNHFLPFQAALAVVAGTGVSAALYVGRRACLVALLSLAQVAVVGVWSRLEPTLPSLAEQASLVSMGLDGRMAARIAAAREEEVADIAVLARHPGDVVAENMALPVRAGRPPVLTDPSTLFAMAEAGHWDEAPFLEAVRARRFGVIILQRMGPDNLRFSEASLAAIREHYVEADQVGGDHVLVPRPASR